MHNGYEWLRENLLPYSYGLAVYEHETGMPMMRRPLSMELPGKPEVEGQPESCPESHDQIDEHRHPRCRNVQKDDAIAFALLGISRGDQKTNGQTGNAEERRQRPEPGNHFAGQRIESLRAGESVPVDESCSRH